MRKRSTRLFGILLHLVCTSQDYYTLRYSSSSSSTLGMEMGILLDRIDLRSYISNKTNFHPMKVLEEVLGTNPFFLQITVSSRTSTTETESNSDSESNSDDDDVTLCLSAEGIYRTCNSSSEDLLWTLHPLVVSDDDEYMYNGVFSTNHIPNANADANTNANANTQRRDGVYALRLYTNSNHIIDRSSNDHDDDNVEDDDDDVEECLIVIDVMDVHMVPCSVLTQEYNDRTHNNNHQRYKYLKNGIIMSSPSVLFDRYMRSGGGVVKDDDDDSSSWMYIWNVDFSTGVLSTTAASTTAASSSSSSELGGVYNKSKRWRKRSRRRRSWFSKQHQEVEQQEEYCMARRAREGNTRNAHMIPCHRSTSSGSTIDTDDVGSSNTSCDDDNDDLVVVQFDLVRYTTATIHPQSSIQSDHENTPIYSSPSSSLSKSSSTKAKSTTVLASSTVFPMHRALTPITQDQTSQLLRQSHPALHMSIPLTSASASSDASKSSGTISNHDVTDHDGQVHSSSVLSEIPVLLPRMVHDQQQEEEEEDQIIPPPSNPYLTSADAQGIYTDPATELTYPTDLCTTLLNIDTNTGTDTTNVCTKKTRHLLMGIGQYTRTVFKLKVYGIALYISQADILLLSDRFGPYANLAPEVLRSSNEWYYDILMSPEAGLDRTLVLNLNMQLSCDTMRASLDADWSFLSAEHKTQLNSMTLKPRLANERMLGRILDEANNPSKCSCGQIAPKEYEADTSCCARGSELAYTWRKNGDLEVRLDGRVMDVFSDVRIGQGIFYEYLRQDEPMSVEARDNFSTGVSHLLYPLSRNDYKAGFSSSSASSINSNSSRSRHMNFEKEEGFTPSDPQQQQHIFASFPAMLHDAAQSHVYSAFQYVSNTQEELIDSIVSTTRLAFSTTRGIAINLNEQRERFIEQSLSLLNFQSHDDDSMNRAVGSDASSSMSQWNGRQHSSTAAQLSASVRLAHGHISHSNSGEMSQSGNVPISSRHQPSVTERLFLRNNGNMNFHVSDEISVMPINHAARNAARRSIASSSSSSENNAANEEARSLPHRHQIFFAMVHLYLVLLLIVSLPAEQSTTIVVRRGKVLARRKRGSKGVLHYDEDGVYDTPASLYPGNPSSVSAGSIASNASITSSSSNNHKQSVAIATPTPAACQNARRMKKSLSYYL